MKVTVLYGEKAAEFDIDHNEKIEDVKAIAEVEVCPTYTMYMHLHMCALSTVFAFVITSVWRALQ